MTLNMNVDMLNGAMLPGIFHMQKGYNAYKGYPLFEGGQSAKDVFAFTFKFGRVTSGDNDYQVPDQLEIPPLSYMCEFSNRASEVVTGSSTDYLEAFDKAVSKAADAKVSVPIKKIKVNVGGSFRNANSSSRQASERALQEGNSQQIINTAVATLFTYKFRTSSNGALYYHYRS